MTSRQLILLLVALVGLGIIFTAGRLLITAPTPSPTQEPVACTLDAKLCPDGSAVGRVPPSCEFAACPLSTTTPSKDEFTLSLGERGGTPDFRVEPVEVVEDSRCGINVVCIQAGTIKLKIKINSIETVLEMNKPAILNGKTITLSEVSPSAYAGKTIAPSEYRFTFRIN